MRWTIFVFHILVGLEANDIQNLDNPVGHVEAQQRKVRLLVRFQKLEILDMHLIKQENRTPRKCNNTLEAIFRGPLHGADEAGKGTHHLEPLRLRFASLWLFSALSKSLTTLSSS